jgi:hypothetical protein
LTFNGSVLYVNGNVGIGTTSPSSILYLSSTGPTILTIEADTDNVTETDNARIILKQDGGLVVGRMGYASGGNSLEITNEYYDDLVLGTNNTERVRINLNGNVGIGTSSPAAKLHTSGPVALSGLASGTGAAILYIDATGNLTSGVAPAGGGSSVTLSGPNNGIVTRDGAAGTTLIAETNYEFNASTRLMYLSGQIGINFTGNTGSATPLEIHGTGGELFSIDDDLTSSLMSVNTIAGLPVFEAFADSTVTMGQYGSGDFIITGNRVGIGTSSPTSNAKVEIIAPTNVVGMLDYVSFNRQTSNYTLVLGDAGKIVEMNVATANTGTVPLNSSVAFKTGTKIDIVQYGSGVTTITGSAGVTLRTANDWTKINARYGVASLVKVATDEWYLFGNLSA